MKQVGIVSCFRSQTVGAKVADLYDFPKLVGSRIRPSNETGIFTECKSNANIGSRFTDRERISDIPRTATLGVDKAGYLGV